MEDVMGASNSDVSRSRFLTQNVAFLVFAVQFISY